jgi:hypothetical protein
MSQTAHLLAKQAFVAAQTQQSSLARICTNLAHANQCPFMEALHSVSLFT